MSKQERPLQRVYPHPYIMDSKLVEQKLELTIKIDPEGLKNMIREFVRYHAFCADATALLSCNIDRIASGLKPHHYPEINVPHDCPDPQAPWPKS